MIKMELKTLKDLIPQEDREDNLCYVSEEELKAEAIKWVKDGGLMPNVKEWVKHFHNITEEDLKLGGELIKMEKEFKLFEKERNFYSSLFLKYKGCYLKEDVKEFIRLLKKGLDEIHGYYVKGKRNKFIDKLSGLNEGDN